MTKSTQLACLDCGYVGLAQTFSESGSIEAEGIKESTADWKCPKCNSCEEPSELLSGDAVTKQVVAVCCFKEDHYRWFLLPERATKQQAERWALDTIGMPAENFRYVEE